MNTPLIGRNCDGFNILIVDDDTFCSSDYALTLEDDRDLVWTTKNPEEFVRFLEFNRNYLDIIIVDIRMHYGGELDYFTTRGGYSTGVELAKIASSLTTETIIVALTLSKETRDIVWFENRKNCYFCHKHDFPPKKFKIYIESLKMKKYPKLQSFIVHGHDKIALLELKNYVQNILDWPEPIILNEKASGGKTVIEKFEYYSDKVDIVFALFTPDDFIGDKDDIRRARQNVIFEFGYFMGKMGRNSGRVFMLYKKGVEIPSDLMGVIYVDITNGIDSAGETLRKEIESIWLM